MRIVLLSTYDLGRQPFGLASPAAWLREQGHGVTCVDLAVSPFPTEAITSAELVAIYLPMHTAARLAGKVIPRVVRNNPAARLCAYGLYAPLNEAWLRQLGVHAVIGGEFEAELCRIAAGETPPAHGLATRGKTVSLDRLQFRTPDRAGLPLLGSYAHLVDGDRLRTVGSTEASRGCKHLCRHCPVVPVYEGTFRVVQSDVVLADIRAQVAAGAQHITFADPDFFNGPTHAVRIVEALHREFPEVTYDVTIKIEHLRQHSDRLPVLRDTGCRFVVSAVESVDDEVLRKLDKGHTRDEFVRVIEEFRRIGLALAPTFIAFLPWTTRAGYRDLLAAVADLDLVEAVSPVQLALRLLLPAGSRLLELGEIQSILQGFDDAALVWRWRHVDPEIDRLAAQAFAVVARGQKTGSPRRQIFDELWALVAESAPPLILPSRAAIPYLNEPWYC